MALFHLSLEDKLFNSSQRPETLFYQCNSAELPSHKDAILKDTFKAVRYCIQASIKYVAEVCNSNKYIMIHPSIFYTNEKLEQLILIARYKKSIS